MNIQWKKLKTEFRFKYANSLKKAAVNLFWFFSGAIITLFLLTGLAFFIYQATYSNKVYPGVFVNGTDFGGKTQDYVKNFFDNKNKQIGDVSIEFLAGEEIATTSAKDLGIGYNSDLLATQALSIGRSNNVFSNMSLILQAYISGIHLPYSYTFSDNELKETIKPLNDSITTLPVEAQFEFENGRVTTFKPSSEGQTIDMPKLEKAIQDKTLNIITSPKDQAITIEVPIQILKPNITTDKANDLGIKELIGEGHSLFYHSIPSRVYNVNLAATRINGVLVAPGEVFSFDKALGDVSVFTGYKQAYIIQNGRTVLGDGGGVCQVSTTFFRAILDAGLPIVERHAHAYRVGYYEEDSPPGIDATIYVPSVDLKFKNDTGNYILVQSVIDLNNLSLAFYLYGTKDGREVSMTTPVITNQTPPPPPLYQDDPELPVGQVKQTDFAAWGANVYFTRTVTKNGKTLYYDKFVSNYQPWQAVYLKGTKQP